MKKMRVLAFLALIVSHISSIHAYLIVNTMNSTGNTELQGAVIDDLLLTGVLLARDTTFTTITLDGSMTVIDSTIAAITVTNAVIAPSDRTVVLNASTVTGNIVFAGAAGKVFLQNGSTIGGSVTNGTVIVE